MTSAEPEIASRSAVVIGGSLAGILIAAALTSAGCSVTVLERDRLPTQPRPRHGVPQDRQPHILLHRGLTAIETLLPGFRQQLVSRGAVTFDSGSMPWFGEFGWLDTSVSTYEVASATRPLIEAVARRRLMELTPTRIRDGVAVRGLRRVDRGWLVDTDAGTLAAEIVVDASGRSSRLPHWLGIAPPPTELVDARVGYAGRLYREWRPIPLRTGVMVFSSAGSRRAGLALPVEDHGWLVAAAGFGDHRPPRDEPGFQRHLDGLRDPALSDLTASLAPVSDIAIHRQTANLRRRWDRLPGLPAGLLVAGDAMCSLDPVYGQGITVVAEQAEIVARAGQRSLVVDRALQRRLVAVTQAAWSIATLNDRRQPSCPDEPSTAERWSTGWATRIGRLAAAGDVRATRTIAAVNHLMVPPSALFHPALVRDAVRRLPDRRLPRPAVLDELSRHRLEQPPVDPADV